MKNLVKAMFRQAGLDVRRLRPPPAPASVARAIGEGTDYFFEDLRARGFRPRGILDVGANSGDWTRQTLAVFPNTPVLMIEPQEEMQAALAELCRQQPFCRRVQAGAGRAAGELVQTIWEDLAGSSFLPPADDQALKEGRQRRTKIVTIDSLLAGDLAGFQPDLVKLDIQGFELEALLGAAGLFGRTEVFVVEASLLRFLPGQPIAREVIAFMAERGYELYDITGSLRRPLDGCVAQLDLAFVQERGKFRDSAAW